MYHSYRQKVQDSGEMEYFKLNTGNMIPAVGLGTWQSAPGKVQNAVEVALSCGYRLLDCAMVYGNEAEVGKGIQTKMADGTVAREDVFVVSKLWCTYMRPGHVSEGIRKTLTDLQLSYVDLYLIHWPVALKEGSELLPVEEDGRGAVADVDYLETYQEMEKLVDQGLVKAIGLSNFNCKQIERVLSNCRIKPAANQVETHPYFNQKEMLDFCRERDIQVMAYSPLGSPDRPWVAAGDKGLLHNPIIKAIGDKYNKSPGQVAIRYAVQRNTCVIPKSITPSRIQENLQVMDFKLSAADMNAINNMDKGIRLVKMDIWRHSKYYPFNDDVV